MKRSIYFVSVVFATIGGCSDGDTGPVIPEEVVCHADTDCAAIADRPQCDVRTTRCRPRAFAIGTGDGSTSSVALTVVFEATLKREPTGLAFNPEQPNELWIVNRRDDSIVIVQDPGQPSMSFVRLVDPAAGHFMHRPPGLAFGSTGSWATCGETDNAHNGGASAGFMGPAAFPTDRAILAKQTSGGLGSHYDMLHNTPWCMGIAHERDNVYWVFDGAHGSLARYDFGEFHEPGGDDHSDGEIGQYAMGEVLREPGIPSHLVFNRSDNRVYAADTGNRRIVRLDPSTATDGGSLSTFEPTVPRAMENARLDEIVAPGTLIAPSGLALDGNLLYVTDNATGRIHAFELDGRPVRTLDTGLPTGSLAGLTFGPDGKIYFVDVLTARIHRIDP